MEWYWILAIVLGSVLLLFLLSWLLYKPFFKRFWDIVLSGLAILVLSPFLIIFIILGAIFMRGNPFFTQERPGKKEKIFKLIKFRSMSNKKDENGELLPDEQRLGKYGKFIRATSLDELPELFNIFIGNMSLVGPRPLLVRYLPYYSDNERHRHDVRPGLTGLSQIHGRNYTPWEERFAYDLEYVEKESLFFDISVILKTIGVIFSRKGVADRTKISKDENGNLWIEINGEKKKYPQPLDIERKTKQ